MKERISDRIKSDVYFQPGGYVLFDIVVDKPYIYITWPTKEDALAEREALVAGCADFWRKRIQVAQYVGPVAPTFGHGNLQKLFKRKFYQLQEPRLGVMEKVFCKNCIHLRNYRGGYHSCMRGDSTYHPVYGLCHGEANPIQKNKDFNCKDFDEPKGFFQGLLLFLR